MKIIITNHTKLDFEETLHYVNEMMEQTRGKQPYEFNCAGVNYRIISELLENHFTFLLFYNKNVE